MPLQQLEDYADTRLAQKISQLSGVGAVTISGGQKPAVEFRSTQRNLRRTAWVWKTYARRWQPTASTAPRAVLMVLAKISKSMPNDQLLTAEDYNDVVVAYKNNAPVTLRDVATVVDGIENVKLAAWRNEDPAVIVNIQRQPGANIIQVVDRINALLPKLKNTIPAAIDVAILSDRTITVRASVRRR